MKYNRMILVVVAILFFALILLRKFDSNALGTIDCTFAPDHRGSEKPIFSPTPDCRR